MFERRIKRESGVINIIPAQAKSIPFLWFLLDIFFIESIIYTFDNNTLEWLNITHSAELNQIAGA